MTQGNPCLSAEQLASFASRELAPSEEAEVERHLRTCADCRLVLRAIHGHEVHDHTSGAIDGSPSSNPSDSGAMVAAGASVGRYVVGPLLGVGGMGMVYRAHDPDLNREVALKVLRRRAAGEQTKDVATRMRREGQAMARLSHSNVISVFDVGILDDRVWVAMELVQGGTLREWLTRKRRSAAEILRVMLDAGSGLEAAHSAGLVHRDFKPDNVLVGEDGRVRVTDFGLARFAREGTADESGGQGSEPGAVSSALTQTGAVLGTPAYMAPEQGAGLEADARSDQFSFCVTLYEALAGQRPFSIRSDLVARDGSARRPNGLDRIPRWIRKPLLRGLQSLPSDRFGDLGGLLCVLRRGPPSMRGRALGGVALVLCMVSAVILVRARRAPVIATSETGAASAAVPRATTLADLPLPATKVPEALAEYAAGVQALHDNSWGLAERHFARTVDLDPTLAIAHLRLSMVEETDPARKRAEFAEAATMRAQLSARDQLMLEALEPVLQNTRVDRTEALARLERASQRYPLDVEFLDWLGILQTGDPEGALPPSEKAIALDPNDGQAWQTKGQSLALLDRTDEARAAFQRCAEIAVDSTDCLAELAAIDSRDGKCAAYEAEARRLFDRDPEQATFLAPAMFATGHPEAAVWEVLNEALLHEGESRRAVNKLNDERAFATIAGDFPRSVDLARQLIASDIRRDDLNRQQFLAAALAQPLEEMGRDEEARRVAYDFVIRSETWATDTSNSAKWDSSFWLLRLALGPGGLSPDEFERRRSVWIDERLKSLSRYPGLVWTAAYAAAAFTPDEARKAFAMMPRFAPMTTHSTGGRADPDAFRGQVCLLAGRAEEAVPFLRRAVANCDELFWPIVHIRAALHLGQALEATGDVSGACGAYKLVLDRWGNAKPRSVTAEKARERGKSLGCGR